MQSYFPDEACDVFFFRVERILAGQSFRRRRTSLRQQGIHIRHRFAVVRRIQKGAVDCQNAATFAPVDAGLIYHVINRGNNRKLVRRSKRYRWSSYRAHGLGEADELLDSLSVYEQLSPYAAVRRRVWKKKVHLPIEEQTLAAIRRSSATGLPYGDENWVQELSKKLNLDLTIRPRGRPRKAESGK